MKLVLFRFAFVFSVSLQAQVKSRTAKKVLELKMPKTVEDDMPGTRGASVVWHPVMKKYYAAMAGNASYPLAVFEANGKRVSDDDMVTLIDTRGLWYNPIKKRIYGNGYDSNGWFYYNLTPKGLVSGYDELLTGMHQPDAQSVAAYNATAKQVLFLKGSTVFTYDEKGDEIKTMNLHIGRTKAQGISEDEDATTVPDGYNNALIYTGIVGQEIGLLNTVKKKVELYDIKSGFLTGTVILPSTVSLDIDNSFCFAFTNGIYWFFDIDKRVWVGYK
jgi:hypothetical protein